MKAQTRQQETEKVQRDEEEVNNPQNTRKKNPGGTGNALVMSQRDTQQAGTGP